MQITRSARRIASIVAVAALALVVAGCQSTSRLSPWPRLTTRAKPTVDVLAKYDSAPKTKRIFRRLAAGELPAKLARVPAVPLEAHDVAAAPAQIATAIPAAASENRVAVTGFQEEDNQEPGESLDDILQDLETDLPADVEPASDPDQPARLRGPANSPLADTDNGIRQPASGDAELDEQTRAAGNANAGSSAPGSEAANLMTDPMSCPSCQPMTIDLSNALALAGANNQQIALARARVIEANADWKAAKVLKLPTFKFGIAYNYHDGELQSTPGVLIDPTRSALFLGGGNTLNNQIVGGSGGPTNIAFNLSLADACFEPLVAHQLRDAVCAAKASTINDTLLVAGETYFALVESYALIATTQQALAALEEVNRLTTDFAEAGQGSRAEVYRARTERAFWQRVLQDNWRVMNVARAELARHLSLDCTICLYPVEERITPVEMISPDIPCDQLISTAIRCRPEAQEQCMRVGAAEDRVRQEKLRPYLPHIQIGTNLGVFGGGPSGSPLDFDFGLRKDIDAQAIWELRNLGFGNKALRCRRVGQLRQQQAICGFVRDQICAEVKSALAEVQSFRQQIELAVAGLETADQSYRANLERIREGEGIPLELLQAIRARHEAQAGLTEAITDYNQAQFRLLRAVGQAPDADTTIQASYQETTAASANGTQTPAETIVPEPIVDDPPVVEELPAGETFFEQAVDWE